MPWKIAESAGAVSFAGGIDPDEDNQPNDFGVPRDLNSPVRMARSPKPAATDDASQWNAPDTDSAFRRFFPEGSQGEFENLLFQLPMMIFSLDGDGKIITANDAISEVLGYRPEDVTGRHVNEFLSPGSLDLLNQKILPGFFETGRFANVDISLVHKDTSPVDMTMSAVGETGPDGRIARSLVVFTDMSRQAAAQMALRQSEQRFRESFEAAAHGMAILSADGRLVAANLALTELLGKNEYELSRQRLTDIVTSDNLEKVRAMMSRVMGGNNTGVNAEVQFIGPDDSIIYGLTSLSGVRDRHGKIEQLIVQIVDLTSRHKAEETLRQAQKMEAVGQLTGGIAHDFNNLLTVVIGNLQLVEGALKGNDKALKRAHEAIDAATKGSELTRQLLAFARRQSLAPQEVDVNRLIENMGAMLTRSIGGAIELKVDLMDGNPLIKADPAQLESSILNLAINARDAMDKAGRLTIETSDAILDEEYAASHDEVTPGHYVLIAVSDTGSGIAPHVMEKIFQPFYTTKDVGKGTGLGLSMVFGFIKQSGGHIKVYSEEGHGTSFKLYLPRIDTPDNAKEKPQGAGKAKKKILVVEDQEAVRMVAVEFLEDFGYEVLQATNGVEGLEILQNVPDIALLFTDVVMPGGMNGFDLAQAASQLRPELKIIHASGYPKGAMVHQEEPRLKDNLISKPFRRDELRKVVAETLGDDI